MGTVGASLCCAADDLHDLSRRLQCHCRL
jgi:hypothetical protein